MGRPRLGLEGLHGAGQPLGSLPTPRLGSGSRKAVLGEDSAPAPLLPGCGLLLPQGEVGNPTAHVSEETQRWGGAPPAARHRGQRAKCVRGGGGGGGGRGLLLGAAVAAFDQQKLEFSVGALPKTSSQMLRLSLARPRAGKDTRRHTARPVQVASVSPEAPRCARVCLLGACGQCSPTASCGLEGRL